MEGAGGAAVRRDRDWTRGSVTRNLLSLSWPMMVTEGLYMVGISIDMVWVGRLGAAAIAGIGVAGIYAGVQMMLMTGLSVGTRALIARCVGARDIEGANHAGQQAFVISAIYTVVMVAVGLAIAEPVLRLMGFDDDVVMLGADYMRIMFGYGSVTVAFWMMGYSIMQASGDTVTPMAIIILYRIVHVPLSYALVFGWWLFPEMGSSGAAMANVVSRGIGMVLVLWALYAGRAVFFDWRRWVRGWSGRASERGLPQRAFGFVSIWRVVRLEEARLRLSMRHFSVDFGTIWRMVRVGIPASVMGVQRSLALVIVAWIMAPFGTLAVAAHSLLQRVEMLLMPVNLGLGLGAGVLAGQNLGAGQPNRAERSSWQATGLATALMVVCSAAVLVWAEHIVRVFNSDPELVAMTSTFLRIATAGYVMLGAGQVLMQSLSGAGDTVPPMVFGLVTSWAMQLPLAYFLPQVTDLGVLGVRWALVTGVVAQAVFAALYFRLGRWKRKRV